MQTFKALRTALVVATLVAPSTALASYGAGHRSVGAFYTPDDGYGHAIVAESNGAVREVYFSDNTFSSSDVLTSFSGIVAVTGYYTPADHNRHAIVALSNGQIWEVYYNPSWGVAQDLLTTVPAGSGSILGLAGWVSGNGQQNVAIATAEGIIYDYQWPNWQLATVVSLAEVNTFNGLTGFYTSDGYDHIVFARTDSPALEEAYWNQGGAPSEFSTPWYTLNPDVSNDFGTSVLAIGGIADPSGYSGTEDVFFINTANQLRDYAYTPSNYIVGHTTTDWSFTYGPSVLSAGAYTSGSVRHAVVAMTNGDLWDMYQSSPGAGWTYYKLGVF